MAKLPDLPPYRRHGEQYLADPFFGDESDLKCRTVTLKRARKDHLCYGISPSTHNTHGIQKGEVYRHEKALVDRSFWGEYRICLGCMDQFIEGRY